MTTKQLNKDFRFVYSPKVENQLFPLRKRFLIGAGQLSKYLGEKNAERVKKSTEKFKTDKHTIKFRKCGKIEIYVK